MEYMLCHPYLSFILIALAIFCVKDIGVALAGRKTSKNTQEDTDHEING